VTTLDRIAVEDITRQAREISPGRTLLTWIGALLFAVGWIVRKTFGVIWLAGAWTFVAVREGWREAGRARVSRGTG
jgi:hypothetical protein